MVAFSGSDPIGVLIGAKRPSGTLIHKIAVHPDHVRQGHGRHLLTSLSSKLRFCPPKSCRFPYRSAGLDCSPTRYSRKSLTDYSCFKEPT